MAVGGVTKWTPRRGKRGKNPVSVCMCVCVVIPSILDVTFVDVPAGVTQEEGHTGFLIHRPSAVRALKFFSQKDSAIIPFRRRP